MGRDKGALRYYEEPQARHCWRLLGAVCADAFVSLRADQAGKAVYTGLPAIFDRGDNGGPAAGLLAAFDRAADVAWLVLAVDMPLVGRGVLERLVAARDPAMLATGFRHPDGTPEPLCTIWEPRARAPLAARVAAGDGSLRRLLESSPVRLLAPADPAVLRSVDAFEDYSTLRKQLGGPHSVE